MPLPFHRPLTKQSFSPVLIIRFAERKIDKLIDSALIDYSPLSSEIEPVQFESEWSIFRSPFSSTRKKATGSNVPTSTNSLRSTRPTSPTPLSHPPSPVPKMNITMPTTPKSFTSLRETMARSKPNSATPLQNIFTDTLPTPNSPLEMTTFLTALHSLLTDSGINPALITQLWSQVMYWTSCVFRRLFKKLFIINNGTIGEMFNRILTRKRHLCRYGIPRYLLEF